MAESSLGSGPGPRMSWLRRRLRKAAAVTEVQTRTEGLPRDGAAIKPVIEPAHDGTWVLKARKVKSRPSGVPEQQALYASADGEGWLRPSPSPVTVSLWSRRVSSLTKSAPA